MKNIIYSKPYTQEEIEAAAAKVMRYKKIITYNYETDTLKVYTKTDHEQNPQIYGHTEYYCFGGDHLPRQLLRQLTIERGSLLESPTFIFGTIGRLGKKSVNE